MLWLGTTNSVPRNVSPLYSMHIYFLLLWYPRVTQKSVEGHGMLTNDLHVKSLRSCEIRSNCLTLFKGVIVAISVGSTDCKRFLTNWWIEKRNNAFCCYCCSRSGIRELLQWRRCVWHKRFEDQQVQMTFSSHLTENNPCLDENPQSAPAVFLSGC
jgi:hypothetical protein